MARIPDAFFAGGLGQQVARPAGVPRIDDNGEQAVAAAGQRLSQSLLNVATDQIEYEGRQELARATERKQEVERQIREQAAEEKRLKREYEKSQAMTSLVSHENALAEVLQEIRKDPSIPTEKYQEAFSEQAQNIKANFLQSVPQEYQWAFAPTFDEHINSARLKLGEVQAAEWKDKARANIGTMLEELQRSPKSRGDKLRILDESLNDDETWKAAGYGPADKVQKRQKFAETTAEDEIVHLLNTGSPKRIMETLRAQGKDGAYINYPELDPKTRESYYHTAKGQWQQQVAEEERRRKEAERERKEAARDAYEYYRDAKEGLLALDPKTEARLLRTMKGTPYEARAGEVRRKTGGIDFLTKKITEDPLTYGAARMGLSIPSLDAGNPAAWPQQLKARGEVGGAIKAQYGLSYLPILTNAEAKGFAGYLNQQSPQALVTTIDGLQKALGGKNIGKIAQQFAAEDPTLGMVTGLVARGQDKAAYHVANGRRLVKDKGVEVPKPLGDDMQRRFDSELGDALAGLPQARAAFFDAVKSAYVSRATETGQLEHGVNTGLFRETLRSVVGETAKVNGKRTVIPPGLTEGTFRDFFRAVSGDTVKAAGGVRGFRTPEDAARTIKNSGRLYELGDGRYRVAIDGRYLQTSDGKDFILSLGSH